MTAYYCFYYNVFVMVWIEVNNACCYSELKLNLNVIQRVRESLCGCCIRLL